MQTKHIMVNINLILANTFNDSLVGVNWEGLYEKWTDAFDQFKELNKMHQSRLVFTDKMIDKYHKKACNFLLCGLISLVQVGSTTTT